MEDRRQKERKLRLRTAMSSPINSGLPLNIEASEDMLTAKPIDGSEDFPQTLAALRLSRYRIVEWDGRYVSEPLPCPSPSHHNCRTPRAITDSRGIIYVYLAGRPASDSYTGVVERAEAAMNAAAADMVFQEQNVKHRRGPFRCIYTGISSGTGNSVRLCQPPYTM